MTDAPQSPDLLRLQTQLLARDGRREGREIRFLCPAHPDRRPSARWNPEKSTWFCDVCHHGGGWRDLTERLGQPAPDAPRTLAATHPYRDPAGALLYEVLRFTPNGFACRRPDPAGGWRWDLQGVPRVLYRLPELLAAVARGIPIFLTEGEKDADALAPLGLEATTHAGGAGKWRSEYAVPLRAAHVVLLPDNDDPGRAHMLDIEQSLRPFAASVRRLDLPGLPPKGDVSDWLAARRAEGQADEALRDQLLGLAHCCHPAATTVALPQPSQPAAPPTLAPGSASVLPHTPFADTGAAPVIDRDLVLGIAPLGTTSCCSAAPLNPTHSPEEAAGFDGCSGAPSSSSPWWKSVAPRCERRGVGCQAPRRRRCGTSSRSGAAADGPAPPQSRRCGVPPRAASPRLPALPEVDLGAIAAPPTGDNSLAGIHRLSDVVARPVHFLWEPYLPLGKLTLLDGDPGQGKSWLTAAIATAGSHGRGLPGTPPFEPFTTLFFTEDPAEDVLRTRLDLLGADCSRILACDTFEHPLDLSQPADVLRTEQLVAAYGARLVVIDPIQAFLGAKTDIYRPNEVRAVLTPLLRLAKRHNCALLVLRHITKARASRSIYAGQGSVDFIAAARSVLLAGSGPEDPNRHALVHLKSNLAPTGPTLAYRVDGRAFLWEGTSSLTANDLLAAEAQPDDAGAEQEARLFLRDILASAENLPARAVLAAAREAGVAERTLKRAKRREGIRTLRQGFGTGSVWLWSLPIPPTVPPAPEPCHPNTWPSSPPPGPLRDEPAPAHLSPPPPEEKVIV
jgi:hypothetical protein